jgi:hypothetical protein
MIDKIIVFSTMVLMVIIIINKIPRNLPLGILMGYATAALFDILFLK